MFSSSHLGRDLDSFAHAVFTSDTLACDIEGCAVIDRGADNRQADADVYAAVEGQQLHGDMALIVVHGHHDVVMPFDRSQKDRVGRLRIADMQTAFARFIDGGLNLARLVVAKQAALARVGVQARDRDAWLVNAQGVARAIG